MCQSSSGRWPPHQTWYSGSVLAVLANLRLALLLRRARAVVGVFGVLEVLARRYSLRPLRPLGWRAVRHVAERAQATGSQCGHHAGRA